MAGVTNPMAVEQIRSADEFLDQRANKPPSTIRPHWMPATEQRSRIVRDVHNEGLQYRDSQEERVTLKMDVSFSDHSFIIGRMGKGSQGIMNATGCHVHFPDSNRNHRSEKSNQVSVAGPPAGVLAARRKIRERLPISLAFVVSQDDYLKAVDWSDNSVTGRELVSKPRLKQIIDSLQNQFSITITCLPMDTFCTVITVRGRRSNFARIREGFLRLAAFLSPGKPQPIVQLGIEVSPHHLDFVLGVEEIKVRSLMHATDTRFTVRNVQSDALHHMPTVRIFGGIDNVYRAWLAFMDLLPIVLYIDIQNNWRIRGGMGETSTNERIGSPCRPHDAKTTLKKDTQLSEAMSLNELVKLREMGVISSDALTAVLSSAQVNGSIGFLSPGFRYIVNLVIKLNVVLSHYETTLSLRLARDSRSWKIAIKGPEEYVDIMMETYRALTNLNHDPVELLSAALLVMPPPVTFPQVDPSILPSVFDTSIPPVSFLLNTVQERQLYDKPRTQPMLTMSPSAETSQRSSQCASGCVPRKESGHREICKMFATLLKISGELVNRQQPLGQYAVPPRDASAPPPISMWYQLLANKLRCSF